MLKPPYYWVLWATSPFSQYRVRCSKPDISSLATVGRYACHQFADICFLAPENLLTGNQLVYLKRNSFPRRLCLEDSLGIARVSISILRSALRVLLAMLPSQ